MANRHLARQIALQTLFEWDFNGCKTDTGLEILKRTIEEFGTETVDSEFTAMLFDGVVRKQSVIDDIITKAAPEWPLDKINIIDRNILRIGLFELLFGNRDEVPPKVAINESIELAKNFGGENSSRFVNGVIGAVYKEIGEPGKEQVSKKKAPIDLAKIPVEKKGGAVVYTKDGDAIYIAMVHDVFGYWTLAKGGIDDIDDEKEGVRREVSEELGIEISVEESLGLNEYVASHPQKGKIKKVVVIYLARTEYQPLTLQTSGGLDDARWFPINEVVNLKMYEDVIPLITKAIGIITA
ncbi:MAG: transcription antitermination factor NusB [Minisyncoccia bacterium]